jgi:hypothetical protein
MIDSSSYSQSDQTYSYDQSNLSPMNIILTLLDEEILDIAAYFEKMHISKSNKSDSGGSGSGMFKVRAGLKSLYFSNLSNASLNLQQQQQHQEHRKDLTDDDKYGEESEMKNKLIALWNWLMKLQIELKQADQVKDLLFTNWCLSLMVL